MAVTDTLKDAAYVGIGFGVLGYQKAQVRRHELTARITSELGGQKAQIATQVSEGRKAVTSLASHLDEYVAPVRSQVETRLDTVEGALPTQVQDLLKQARTAVHAREAAVRHRLGVAPA